MVVSTVVVVLSVLGILVLNEMAIGGISVVIMAEIFGISKVPIVEVAIKKEA